MEILVIRESKAFYHSLTRLGLFPFSFSFPLCEISCSNNESKFSARGVLVVVGQKIYAGNEHFSIFLTCLYTHFSEAIS